MGTLALFALCLIGFGVGIRRLARAPRFVAEPRFVRPFERDGSWNGSVGALVLIHRRDNRQYAA